MLSEWSDGARAEYAHVTLNTSSNIAYTPSLGTQREKQVLEPYSFFFPAVFGSSCCSTQVSNSK